MPREKKAAFNSSTRYTDARASRVLSAERRSGGSWWDSAGRTTVRSASEAKDLVRYLDHRFHGSDLVHANHVRAAQNRRRHGCGRCAFQQFLCGLIGLRQERLARRTDQDRQIEPGQFLQSRQDLGILLPALTEAEP